MTSAALAQSDATERWASLQRHQIAGLVVAVGATATWLLASSSAVLLLVAVVAAGVAIPMGQGDTIGTKVVTSVQFVVRSKWTTLVVRDGAIAASEQWWAGELEHRGRLDLSGRDAIIMNQVSELLSAMAATPTGGHLTIQVVIDDSATRTLLTGTSGALPVGWRPVAKSAPLAVTTGTREVREQWSSVSTVDGSFATLRVTAFAPNTVGALLEPLQRVVMASIVSVHLAVVPSARALRITGRAVHRTGVDAAAAGAMGFRRSARSDHQFERLHRREILVAQGAPLVQLAVYLTICGHAPSAVNQAVRATVRQLRDAGIVVSRGHGRQAQYFRWSLPGGASW